jgi:hypothetical protein
MFSSHKNKLPKVSKQSKNKTAITTMKFLLPLITLLPAAVFGSSIVSGLEVSRSFAQA